MSPSLSPKSPPASILARAETKAHGRSSARATGFEPEASAAARGVFAAALAPAFCAVAFFAALAWSGFASAQPGPTCIPYDATVRTLTLRHGERLIVKALDGDGDRVEIWASDRGTTWTAIVVVEGMACPIGNGRGLEIVGRLDRGL